MQRNFLTDLLGGFSNLAIGRPWATPWPYPFSEPTGAVGALFQGVGEAARQGAQPAATPPAATTQTTAPQAEPQRYGPEHYALPSTPGAGDLGGVGQAVAAAGAAHTMPGYVQYGRLDLNAPWKTDPNYVYPAEPGVPGPPVPAIGSPEWQAWPEQWRQNYLQGQNTLLGQYAGQAASAAPAEAIDIDAILRDLFGNWEKAYTLPPYILEGLLRNTGSYGSGGLAGSVPFSPYSFAGGAFDPWMADVLGSRALS